MSLFTRLSQRVYKKTILSTSTSASEGLDQDNIEFLMKVYNLNETYNFETENNSLFLNTDYIDDTNSTNYNYDSTQEFVSSSDGNLAEIISISYSASITPDTALVAADYDPGDTGSVSLFISRDGGSNWTQASLDTEVDISSQPTGTSMKIKAELNGDAELNAWSIMWKDSGSAPAQEPIETYDWQPSTEYTAYDTIVDPSSNYLYRATVDFTSDSTDIQNDIDAGKLESVGGSSTSSSSSDVSLSQVTKLGVTTSIDSVVDEELTAVIDAPVSFRNKYLQDGTLTVTSSDGSTTYTEGDSSDYTVDYKNGKITTLSSGSITDGENLLVSYDFLNAKEIVVDIPSTDTFKRIPVEVLKFVPGKENLITTIADFDNADADDFEDNYFVEFDGTMHLKTSYTDDMVDEGVSDYRIDYWDGALKALSTGVMSDATDYEVNYEYVTDTVTGEGFTSSYDTFVSLVNSALARYTERVYEVNSVTNETFNSNTLDSAVSLANSNLVDGSVTVTNTAEDTTFTEGTDYEMDYENGDITVLSSGNMSGSTDYYIDYDYNIFYERNVDYEIDYYNGEISVLSGGNMADATSYSIDYGYGVFETITGESFTSSYDTAVSLANSDIVEYSERVYETSTVTNETFNSNTLDSAVSLNNSNLVDGTVTVTNTAEDTTFTEDTDYTIDYSNGDITVLSSGSMASSTDYYIDYDYDIEYSNGTDFTIDYVNGTITVLTQNVTEEYFVSDFDVAVNLNNTNLVSGSEIVTSTDGSTTYTEGTDYSMDYASGTITALTSSVTDETFTSNFDTAVSLANTNLKSGSVTVTTTDGSTTFTEDTDYSIDYPNGDITVLSGGSMSDATDYYIDYSFGNMADSNGYYIGYDYAEMDDSTSYSIDYDHTLTSSHTETITSSLDTFVALTNSTIVGDTAVVTTTDGATEFNSYAKCGDGKLWSQEINLDNYKSIESLEVV